MIGSTGAVGDSVRLNERTGGAILRRMALYAAVACAGGLAFALGSGLSSWAVAYWLFLWLVGWLANTLGTTEWTIAGRELRRRRWLSKRGSKPSLVTELGPQVEIVHESWGRWRIWPGGMAIDVQPWLASRFVGAMRGADVGIDDWRGTWTSQHRLLNAAGLLVLYGGAAALLLGMAFAPLRPGSAVGFVAFYASVSAMLVGLAINLLPWRMRKPSGPSDRAWDLRSHAGPGQGLAYGGFWIRVAAYMIDAILLGGVDLFLVSTFGPVGAGIAVIVVIAYVIGLWATIGQTLGMMTFGLRIVRSVDGRKLTWGNAVLRFIGLVVAFGCADIGVVWVAFDAQKRGWHDIMSGTVVVRNVG